MERLPTDLWNIVNNYLFHQKGQRVEFFVNDLHNDLQWWSSWSVITGTIEQVIPDKNTYVIRCDDGTTSCFLISDSTGITSGTLTHLIFI